MRRAQFALLAVVVGAIATVTPAGGSTEQAPKRGGTVVLTGVPREPACLNAFIRALPGGWSACRMGHEAVLPGAFRVGPGLELRPNLVSRVDVTKTPPFTLTYRIRPEARWSDGTPVSARDFVFTHRTNLSAGVEYDPEVLAQIAERAVARCQDREGRSPLALRRLASPLPVRAPPACARRRGLRERVERPDPRSGDRTPDRKWSLPRPRLGPRP